MRKRKNKKNKLRKILLILLFIFVAINLFLNKKIAEKINKIKNEYSKTDVANIYVQEDKKFNLVIVNDNEYIKEIKGLDDIGEIKKDKPILIVRIYGKYGYIDSNGDILIPMEYDALGTFIDGKVFAKKDTKIGVLNEEGEEVLPLQYDEIYMGENNTFIMKEGSIYSSCDLKTKTTLNIDEVYKVNEKILIFSNENKFGIMNYKGEIIIPNTFDEISTFIDKIFIGYKEQKYSLYNLKNEKISGDYDFIEQIGNNEYKGGNNEIGNYAFLSAYISTEDKYENIRKYDESIYIGELKNDTSDVIEVESKSIRNLKNDDVEKYIKKIKGEKSNE